MYIPRRSHSGIDRIMSRCLTASRNMGPAVSLPPERMQWASFSPHPGAAAALIPVKVFRPVIWTRTLPLVIFQACPRWLRRATKSDQRALKCASVPSSIALSPPPHVVSYRSMQVCFMDAVYRGYREHHRSYSVSVNVGQCAQTTVKEI